MRNTGEKQQLAEQIREEERTRFEREYQARLQDTKDRMNDVRGQIENVREQ